MNSRPFPIALQGVLPIKEQDIETGGFQAVHYPLQHFEEWVKTQPEDYNAICPHMNGLSRECVDVSPGDLLVFNSLLAHGVRANHS